MMMQQQQVQQSNIQHDLSFQVDYGNGMMNGAAGGVGGVGVGTGPMNNNNYNSNPNVPSGMIQQQQLQLQPGSTSNNNTTLEFVQNQLKQSSHPTVIIFHILFKLCSLLVYIFSGWFMGNGNDHGARFITITVIIILLLAADFWVVKNVTGRLLVGLRWWNQVDDDSTKWIFESAENNSKRPINNFDQTIFWTILYGTPFIWCILFIIGLITFEWNWLLIVIMALTLSGANVYGYYKCSNEQKIKTQQMMQQYATQGAIAVMRTNIFSTLSTAAVGIASAAASTVAGTNTTTINTTNGTTTTTTTVSQNNYV